MREYELILMLDTEAPDERREEITDSARQRIESAGTVRHAESWGTRTLAFEIDKKTQADYRFFRFEGEKPLLDDLEHNLKITDGLLRFRIFRVEPDAPLVTPPMDSGPMPQREDRDERGGRGGRDDRDDRDGDRDSIPAAPDPAPQPVPSGAEAADEGGAVAAEAPPAVAEDVADAAPADENA